MNRKTRIIWDGEVWDGGEEGGEEIARLECDGVHLVLLVNMQLQLIDVQINYWGVFLLGLQVRFHLLRFGEQTISR